MARVIVDKKVAAMLTKCEGIALKPRRYWRSS
jgi:hypothetical protein